MLSTYNSPAEKLALVTGLDPHIVKLGYNDEYIQDSTWAVWDLGLLR